jgi:metal-dependent amidase/aminoacylase/carboxypeptidase family protein
LKENIIPASAEFTLDIRTFDDAVRAQVLAAVRRIVSAEAAASGAPEPEIEELYTFPACYNEPAEAEGLAEVLRGAVGEDAVSVVPALMGSEDFGHLAAAIDVPAVYWFFGGHSAEVVNGEGHVPMNHSPFFAPVMEPTLSTGVKAAVAALRSRLGR